MEKVITLAVVLRKEVVSEEAAENLYSAVKAKFSDMPDVRISGSINTKFVEEE